MITLKLDNRDIKTLFKVATKLIENHVVSDITTEIKKQISDQKLSAEGHLLQSVMPDFDQNIVFINAPYAGYVEYGTPGLYNAPTGMPKGRVAPPPIDVMERWAKLKLASKYGENKSKRRKNLEKKMAQDVAKHIYFRGTMPHPFVRNAIDKVEMKYRKVKLTIDVKVQ